MGHFEYSVGLANASTPQDMEFVAGAFRAGELKERQRITDALEAEVDGSGHITMALFKLRKIIDND